MKITFKKQKGETGLASIGAADVTAMKVKRVYFGYISGPSWRSKDSLYRINFMVKDDKWGCGWRWVTLKKKGNSEQEAREIAKEIIPGIKSMEIHFDPDHEDC